MSTTDSPSIEKAFSLFQDVPEALTVTESSITASAAITNSPKRIKHVTEPSTIIQLCTESHTNVFEGDILIVYGPAQNRSQNSPVKTKIFHANLVDRFGLMTITATINDSLINRFSIYILPGKSIKIIGFELKKKGQYDRGDAIFTITILPDSIIEPIEQVCKLHSLPPDMTISEVIASNESYVVGSIAAIVVGCQYNNKQLDFFIRDGQIANDFATLQVNEAYKNLFFRVQQQLAIDEPSFYLFKNIVRNGNKGSHMIKTSQSTFIDPLNDESPIQFLLPVVEAKIQVYGTLKVRNVFAPPFQCICSECKFPMILNTRICAFCNVQTKTIYEHNLLCNLDTDDGIIECTLRGLQLQEICPNIAALTYEQYSKTAPLTVFNLRRICLQGLYTLAMNNRILDVKRI